MVLLTFSFILLFERCLLNTESKDTVGKFVILQRVWICNEASSLVDIDVNNVFHVLCWDFVL